MGSSTEIIQNTEISGLMDTYGMMNKRLFLEDGKKINIGMGMVINSRGQTIAGVKSMYNKPYLRAMGYEPSDSIAINKINEQAVLNYTKANIDQSARRILSYEIDSLDLLDKSIYEIQNYQDYNADERSFTYSDGKKYLYTSSVQNGNYIDISLYLNQLDTIIPYLDVTYDSYDILMTYNEPKNMDGTLKWEVKILDKSFATEGDPLADPPIEPVEPVEVIEYITCIFETIQILDTDYSDMVSIMASNSGSFNRYSTATIEPYGDYGGESATILVTGTTLATYTGQKDYIFTINAPNPYSSGGLSNSLNYAAWELGVNAERAERVKRIEDSIAQSVRKLIWYYNDENNESKNKKIAYVLFYSYPNFITKEQADAYPIIPLKEFGSIVNSRNMDLVLKKIGLEGKDFHSSLSQPEIFHASLIFGLPVNATNPAAVQYFFEYYYLLSGMYYPSSGQSVTSTIEIAFRYLEIDQTYTVAISTNEGSSRPKGSYWYSTVTDTIVNVVTEEGVTRYETSYITYPVYNKQEGDNYYISIKRISIRASYNIAGYIEKAGYDGVDITSSKYYDDDIKIRIPIIKSITNLMRFDYLCDTIEQSMAIAYYTYKAVKTKWYQSGFFQFVMFIVAAVITYFSWGTLSWLGKIIVVAALAVSALTMMGLNLGIFGQVVGYIALIYGTYSTASAAIANVTVQNVMLLATNILRIASTVNNFYFSKDITSLQKNQQEMLGSQNSQLEKERKIKEENEKNKVGNGINMFGSSVPDVGSYYDLAVCNFDQYNLMFNYATDFDKFFKTS